MEHPSFQSLYTMEWVNNLKQKLKAFIHERSFELGLPHLSQSPSSLFMVFTNQNSEGAGEGAAQKANSINQVQPRGENNVATDSVNDRLSQMQKTLMTQQRKEQYAKKALYESQIKWTHFSTDIIRYCKELIEAMETLNIMQYTIDVAM